LSISSLSLHDALPIFIWTWSSFLIPLVLTLNKPELRTLAVGMESFVGTYSSDYAGMTAAATISLLPVMLVFIVMQRYFIEGVARSEEHTSELQSRFAL